MKNDDVFYLRYMIEDAQHIKTNLPIYEEFVDNVILRTALLKFAENIGEGSKHLSDQLIEATAASFPWKMWIKFRDRNVHGYFSIDYDIVWEALQNISEKVDALVILRDALLKGGDV
jgi:uncharacterized protein with HEPN domain